MLPSRTSLPRDAPSRICLQLYGHAVSKKKPFSTCSEAIRKLVEDVPAGNFRTYDVSSFPTGIEVFPEEYRDKCSHFHVATSGASDGLDWMVICPIRVDPKAEAYDIDPAIVVLDSASLKPGPSGLVGYHQDYSGRTQPITGAYDWQDHPGTVEKLREQITTGVGSLAEAPTEVLNSLHFMVEIIRDDSDWPKPTTSGGDASGEP